MLFLRLVFRVVLISSSKFWWGLPKKGRPSWIEIFGGPELKGITSFFQGGGGGADTLDDTMYFLFISRLQKYCVAIFIWKIIRKMFMWIFCFFVVSTIRGKIVLKGVSNIIGMSYRIAIIKGEYSWYIGGYSFWRNGGFNSFSCILNVIPIFFQNIYHNKPVYFSS